MLTFLICLYVLTLACAAGFFWGWNVREREVAVVVVFEDDEDTEQ